MEFMLMPDGSVHITDDLADRSAVMRTLIALGGVAHYWREPRGQWCCIPNTGIYRGLDDLEVEVDYADVPDVIKLAAMLG